MKEIDKKIKEYYGGKSLSKDQLNRIVDRQKRTQNKPWKWVLKYAAAFCFLLACLFLYKSSLSSEKNPLVERYATEVAYNHHKGSDSDIHTENVQDLNEKMDKLNFEIDLPENINTKYSLLGGKYCSVDKRLAAQLKLKNRKTDHIATLYVLDKIKSDDFDELFLVDSISVQIWNSQSNLFVLASDVLGTGKK